MKEYLLVQKKRNPITGEEEDFTVLELMDMQMISKALKGDQRAYEAVVDRLEGKPKQTTDINALIEEVEPILLENRLLLLQPIEDGYVYTKIICIDSNDRTISCMKLPEIQDPQRIGSAVTYYRRYTLQSLMSLQSIDDDSNLASEAVKSQKQGLSQERFEKALEGIKNGTVSKQDLFKFELTKEQLTKLNEL